MAETTATSAPAPDVAPTSESLKSGPRPRQRLEKTLPSYRKKGSVLRLTPRPASLRGWLADVWAHREVTGILARKDFQARYKRATLGVLWAVAVPLVQGIILMIVFSRVGHFGNTTFNYSMYVLSGTFGWAYFATTITLSSTAIVDGSVFTDKVWFPRTILTFAPALGNLVSLGASVVIIFVAIPLVGAHYQLHLLLLIPACALVFAFTIALGLVTSALDVYFRDVKYMVQAGILVWFYLTPIVYPASALGHIGPWLDFNPVTGITALFQTATTGGSGPMARSVTVTVVATVILLVIGVHAQRRHDRDRKSVV